jgi:hypothetical protein
MRSRAKHRVRAGPATADLRRAVAVLKIWRHEFWSQKRRRDAGGTENSQRFECAHVWHLRAGGVLWHRPFGSQGKQDCL